MIRLLHRHTRAVMYLMFFTWLAGLAVLAQDNQQPAAPPTEIERLQIENLALKRQLIAVTFRAETCEGRLAPTNLATDAKTLEAEFAALKSRLEAARPGYTWDGTQFVKVP